jgi:hypothetical protein
MAYPINIGNNKQVLFAAFLALFLAPLVLAQAQMPLPEKFQPEVRLVPSEKFQQAQILDLTGVYMGKPNGVYYIRQIGNGIYMYGEEKSQSYPPFRSSIAYGTVSGNIVTLTWVDVPKGSTQNSGTLTLSITQPTGMTVLTTDQQTGGFATTQMIRTNQGAILPP